MFEIFEHTADMGLRVRAPDREALFEEAGRGLFHMIADSLDPVAPNETETIELEADDEVDLLQDWLSELLFVFQTRRLLAKEFKVSLNGNRLKAVVRGERYDPQRHVLYLDIKAVTYHGLKIEREGDEFKAEIVMDI